MAAVVAADDLSAGPAQEFPGEDAAYAPAAGEGTQTEPLAPGLVDADAGDEAGDDTAGETGDGAVDAGEAYDPDETDDAAFITGESVPRSAGEPESGALAGRSARAGDDPIFASLPDASYDVPTTAAATGAVSSTSYIDLDSDAYGIYGVEDAFDAPPAPEAPEAHDTPASYDGPETLDAQDAPVIPALLDTADVPHDAALEVDPGPAPGVVLDVASDIARDAEDEPEIVGAPVAMSIPTTPITTLAVEDRQRSRNQLLAAGVAAVAVLVLCLAIVLAATGGRAGDGTPTVEAGTSPTVPVIAAANTATSTAEVATPVPPTATTVVEVSTETTGPIVAPTDTVQPADTEQPADTPPVPTDTPVPVPTDTEVPLPTDTLVPVPTDTLVPVPTDTVEPAPTDTPVPPPTSTRAPAPTDTARPPTNTRAPAPTNTAVPPRPTSTRPPAPPPTTAPTRGIGDLVTGFNGWTVLPLWVQTRNQLPSPDPKVVYRPRGVYWVVRVDARKTLDVPRSFGGTMDFVLRDGNGRLYAELSDHGREPGVRDVARREGLNSLDMVLNQGQAGGTLLIYDIPRGVQPTQLVGRIIEGNGVSPNGQVVWNLQK
ncbi:MAG TPA: hypothetical protein VND68_05490 [Chloroflexia bacterium]|nr:hypothetical protein [Chloroflexia bacterium]